MLRRTDTVCAKCDDRQFDRYLESNEPYPLCEKCGGQTEWLPSAGTNIANDEIPGGIIIRHGLVNEDGSPRKFYSKTDMKRAANELGLTMFGDSPKPYKVHWSGRTKESEKVDPIPRERK